MAEADRLLTKPLQGGLFGEGEYALASMPCFARGLHAVKYLVIRPRAGTVLAVSDDKGEALAAARRVITAAGELTAANDEAGPEQKQLWSDLPIPDAAPAAVPMVSRRRREIFERNGGRCFYCETPLELNGEWDADHQRPRALLGGDEILNMVPACRRCNRSKGALTALEFVAGKRGEA